MTIVMHSKEWNFAMIIIVAYIAIGFVVACMLPTTVIESIKDPFLVPVSEAIAVRSSDPHRVRVFWCLMISIAPIVFIGFSIAAPIKIRAITNKGIDLLVSGLAFVFFGIITTPTIVGFLLFHSDIESPLSRLDRIAVGMAENNFSLFLGGDFILVATVIMSWFSYVAIPVAALRIARHS